jgi:hypothetical protein
MDVRLPTGLARGGIVKGILFFSLLCRGVFHTMSVIKGDPHHAEEEPYCD